MGWGGPGPPGALGWRVFANHHRESLLRYKLGIKPLCLGGIILSLPSQHFLIRVQRLPAARRDQTGGRMTPRGHGGKSRRSAFSHDSLTDRRTQLTCERVISCLICCLFLRPGMIWESNTAFKANRQRREHPRVRGRSGHIGSGRAGPTNS